MDETLKQPKNKYSDELKQFIGKEISEGRLSYRDAQLKYGIKSQGSIGRWVIYYKKGWIPVSS